MLAFGASKHLSKRMAFPKDKGYFFVPWFHFYGRDGAGLQDPQGKYCSPSCCGFEHAAHQRQNWSFSTRSNYVN